MSRKALKIMPTLNEVFSSLSSRRRYEVWFVRLGLADGSGAWWFRYLLTNPGRSGSPEAPQVLPVQVWATWFPAGGKPQSFIQGFSLADLDLSPKSASSFHFGLADNAIDDNSCRGSLRVDGHCITWNLQYRSTFRATLSNKGWIGFSRTPHSDALFSGTIALDGRLFKGEPLGFGVQGHNCGYRHRNFWRWTHAYFPHTNRPPTTLEALAYEMPLGLIFRKAVLWHKGQAYVYRRLRATIDVENQLDWKWTFSCPAVRGLSLTATIDGSGPAAHRLPYQKTDCSGTFDVTNNSLAHASVLLVEDGKPQEKLETNIGAVLEKVG